MPFKIHGNLLVSYLTVLWILLLNKCLRVVPEKIFHQKILLIVCHITDF